MERETSLTGSDVVAALPLPRDRPSSALEAQVVGVAPGDEDLASLLRKRQQWAVRGFSVLQQHQGFPDGFPCQFPVFLHISREGKINSSVILLQWHAICQRGSKRTHVLPEFTGEAWIRIGALKKTHGELDAENPVNSVVDSAHGDDLVLNLGREVIDEFYVSVWNHYLQ
jgi:hypothetical protein